MARRPSPHELLVQLGRVAIVGFALAAFYLVPVTSRDAGPTTRIVIGVMLLAALATMVISQLRSDQDRVGRLVMVLIVVVFGFALVFYSLAVGSPGEFSGLHTRTDALYFTVVTITTIGYGDIHPVGQIARLVVVAVILFDLVFITALASSIASRLRIRVTDGPREALDGMAQSTVRVERRVQEKVERRLVRRGDPGEGPHEATEQTTDTEPTDTEPTDTEPTEVTDEVTSEDRPDQPTEGTGRTA